MLRAKSSGKQSSCAHSPWSEGWSPSRYIYVFASGEASLSPGVRIFVGGGSHYIDMIDLSLQDPGPAFQGRLA